MLSSSWLSCVGAVSHFCQRCRIQGSWHHSGSFGSVWSSSNTHIHRDWQFMCYDISDPDGVRAMAILARMDLPGTLFAVIFSSAWPQKRKTLMGYWQILSPLRAAGTILAPLDLPGADFTKGCNDLECASSCLFLCHAGLRSFWLLSKLPPLWLLWICLDLTTAQVASLLLIWGFLIAGLAQGYGHSYGSSYSSGSAWTSKSG